MNLAVRGRFFPFAHPLTVDQRRRSFRDHQPFDTFNLSWGSKYNFEAGYIVDDAADLDELRDFAGRILGKAVPYLNIQGHRDQRILLEFAANVDSYRAAIEEASCE